MDKIKKKWPDNMKLRDKVNELVEGYNELLELARNSVLTKDDIMDKIRHGEIDLYEEKRDG